MRSDRLQSAPQQALPREGSEGKHSRLRAYNWFPSRGKGTKGEQGGAGGHGVHGVRKFERGVQWSVPLALWALAVAPPRLAWGQDTAAGAQAGAGGAAQPPDAEPEADQAQMQLQREMEAADEDARKHFQVGQALYEAGRFEQAGGEFSEAYRLSQRPQLLYNAYVAYRDANDFPRAIEALRAYLTVEPDVPDRVNLRARLKSMEDTVAQLEAAQAAEAAQQPVQTRLEVHRSWVPTALMAGGAGLVAVSIGTGAATMKKTNELEQVCPGGDCPAREDDNVTRAHRLAVATDVLLFTGIATAVTGLVLRLTGSLDEERQVPVAMGCDAHGCGVAVHGRF